MKCVIVDRFQMAPGMEKSEANAQLERCLGWRRERGLGERALLALKAGIALIFLSRPAEALEHLHRARVFARRAGDVEVENAALNAAGIAYLMQGRMGKARNAWQNPLTEALVNRGNLLLEEREFRGAARLYTLALQSIQDEMKPFIWHNLGVTYRAWGYESEAAEAFDRAGVRLDQKRPVYLLTKITEEE